MNKQLAFAGISIKSYDEELREFEGVATHISPDKVKDVVEPSGAEFTLPLPFLSKHKHDQPVGKIIWAKVEKDGIRVRGQLPKVTEPGLFKDRVDEAWHELKYLGDTMGLSIGFAAKEYDMLPSGGLHFKKWRWDELSLVTVPCNGKATIEQIKSAYAAEDGGNGASANSSVAEAAQAPTARAVSTKPVVKLAQAKGKPMSKLNESLKGYEDALAAKKAERTATVMKSLDEGRTADQAEQETIDTLGAEIKELEKQIVLVKGMIESDLATAKPITGDLERKPAATVAAVPVNHNHAEKGLAMAQLVRLQYHSKGVPAIAAQMAEALKQSLDPRVTQIVKAAVSAGSTGVAAWAGNLVTPGGLYADFVEFLRPQTLLGRFGRDGVPALRTVPFGIPLLGQSTGGAGYWVGEGNAKPLTKFDFTQTKLDPLKVAAITAVTKELLDRSGPAADSLLRDQLVEALRGRLDTDFINPAKAAVAGISPASITNGVTAIPSVGTDPVAIRADVAAVLGAYAAANNPPSSGVWVMPTTLALQLSMMQTPLGNSEFPQLTMRGGNFLGFPVVVSDYVPAETVVFLNASDVYVGDEGGFLVDASDQVALEMADNPVHNSVTPTGSNALVSMWQTNSVAFRAERIINWSKRRPTAVQVLTGVKWGEYTPPVTP